MIKKIALVRPGEYPEGLIIPLGLLYLAGYLLEKMPGVEIFIIDAALEDLDSEDIAERVAILKPDLVGLTGLAVHTSYIREAAGEIRRVLPEATIIAGGPAVTSNYSEIVRENSIDAGVIGEGEETFCQIVKVLRDRGELFSVDGLVFKDGGQGRGLTVMERGHGVE